jgi:taurine dioxygenase
MTLTITDITPAFGARVDGLERVMESGAPLSAADEQLLQRVFDERSLLVFAHQTELDTAYQRYLAGIVIGQRDAAADGPSDDTDRGVERPPQLVSNKREGGSAPYGVLLFHSDMMWAETPFQVLTLYGLEIEQPAVPTVFTSAAAVWDALPDELRARVEGLHAIHQTGQQRRGAVGADELLQPIRERVQESTKPVAYQHPRTGRTLLYVSQMMTREIEELPAEESEALLDELFSHLYASDNVWEHRWEPGDLVMWDNLAIQHARANVSVDGPARTLRKVIAPRSVLANLEAPKFSSKTSGAG